LVESGNSFGTKLFKEVVEERGDQNVLISPLSILMALGMTYNGADGSTKEAMRTTLELSNLSLQEVNESYRSLAEMVGGLDPKVRLEIANSIWYHPELQVEKEFIELSKTYFRGQVVGLDFSDPNAPDIINEWVDESTDGEIKGIVDEVIDPDVIMLLINAVYFKGVWMYQFDEEKTKDDWFIAGDGSRKRCKMMEQRAEYEYLSNDDFQAVDLPYGNGSLSMIVFLPRPGKQIDSLIAVLSGEKWERWVNGFSRDSGDVYLPRFRVEDEGILNEVLKALGMEVAFTRAADFKKICARGELWIDEVKHKSFVQVNEEGTETAAATSVVLTKGPPPSGFRFRVNRPFLFAIREHHSGAILFIGKIVDLPFG
jgi:serpin B